MRNLPNILTTLRLVWLPSLWFFLYQALFNPNAGNFRLGLAFLILLGMTDLLDGYFAKRNNGAWKSEWGAKMDPIADKALFWSCIPFVWAWMLATAADVDDTLMMITGLAVTLFTSPVLLKHAQFDIISTTMRATDAKSARTLGRVKFACDMGAIGMAIIGAYVLEGRDGMDVIVLVPVFLFLAVATVLAGTNVQQRQALTAV